MDSKIKHGYKSLFRDTAFDVVGWSAAIGIGLYTGIVPEALAPAAKALGLTKVLAELFKRTLNKSHPESEIKDADMYFLWKDTYADIYILLFSGHLNFTKKKR